MSKEMYARKASIITGFLFTTILISSSFGIIRHVDQDPPVRPPNSVVARWNSNASCVIVGREWVLTTLHQGGAPSTLVVGGKTYNCTHNSAWQGAGVNADIRLIKLSNPDGTRPNLPFTPPYTKTDEVGKAFTVGGYGIGKVGPKNNSSGQQYGWIRDKSASNTTLRWGCNVVTRIKNAYDMSGRVSNVIRANFDDPYSSLAVDYEAVTIEYDSGGGWFINDNGVWKVAALSRGLEYNGEPDVSRYLDPYDLSPDPDWFDGVRVSTYADWIISIIGDQTVEPMPGDINCDYKVDNDDLAALYAEWLNTNCSQNNNCNNADMNQDGTVDILDLDMLTDHWLEDYEN